MSVTIANATIRIGASAEDVAKGASAAISHMRQFAAEAAAVLGGIRLTAFAYHANDDIEKALIAFEVLLKSADKAKNLMSGMFQFERETPARITELTSAMRQLLVAGFSLKDAPAMLRILGDAAASTGQSFEESMKRITASLAGAQARGWFTGEEIRELQRQVIPAVRYMAEAMSAELKRPVSEGEIVKMYEDKMISTSKAVRAILIGLERDRAGMMKRLADDTYSGIFSTMISQFELFAYGFTKGFDKVMHLKAGLRDVRDLLMSIAANASQMGEDFARSMWFQVPYRTLQALWELLKLVRDTIRAMAPDLGTSLADLKDFPATARNIWIEFFAIVAEGLARISDGFATVFGTFGKAGWLTLGNIGDFFDKNLPGADNPKRIANQKKWAEERERIEQEIRDRWKGRALDKELAAINDWKKAMRDMPRMDAVLDMGVGGAVGGIVAGVKALNDFNRAAKDLELAEKAKDFTKIDEFFKDMGRDIEKNAMTPLQKLKKELSDLEDIFAMGFITFEQYEAEAGNILMKANKANKGDKSGSNEPRVAEAVSVASAEARKLYIAQMQGSAEKSVPDLLGKLIMDSQKQTREVQELVRIAQAGGLVLVP